MSCIIAHVSNKFGRDYVAHYLDNEAMIPADILPEYGENVLYPYFYGKDGYTLLAYDISGGLPTFWISTYACVSGLPANDDSTGLIH